MPGLLTMPCGKGAAPARTEQVDIQATTQPMGTTFDMALLQHVLVARDGQAPGYPLVHRSAPGHFRFEGSDVFTGLPMPARSRPRGRR